MKFCIILPTYNESGNISVVLNRLLKIFKSIKYKGYILVVDDNSPDGTAKIVEMYMRKNKNIFLINQEKKEGLGTAYKNGFKYILTRLKTDIIFQMDADLSHNPDDIKRFLREIKDYDVVIGSRYIKGGGIPSMNIYRKTISFAGNFLASSFLGLKIRDCTSGFRAIKTDKLKSINIDAIKSKSYVFLEELLFTLVKKGARVNEIPIKFDERLKGSSKLRFKDFIEFLSTIIKLKLKK